MSSIFACKMYRNSKNPQKILAAIQSPINQELVLQLKTYLGLDALTLLQQAEEQKSAELAEQLSEIDNSPAAELGDDNALNSSDRPHMSHGGHVPSFTPASDADMLDESNLSTDSLADEGASDDELIDTASAASVSGTTIQATTTLADMSTELLNLLNSRQDTAGVYRVNLCAKDKAEIWIYYNDDVNLNTVMPVVVDLIFASGYSTLAFNRLARSNNAIVFTIEPVAASVSTSDEA